MNFACQRAAPGRLFGIESYLSDLSKLGELAAVKDPGQVYVLGSTVFFQPACRHNTPEILLLQLCKIGGFDENAFECISRLEEYLGRAVRIIEAGPEEMVDLF